MHCADHAVLDHYLAPPKPLLAPDQVSELVINRPREVAVETPRGWSWVRTASRP